MVRTTTSRASRHWIRFSSTVTYSAVGNITSAIYHTQHRNVSFLQYMVHRLDANRQNDIISRVPIIERLQYTLLYTVHVEGKVTLQISIFFTILTDHLHPDSFLFF